MKDDDDKDNVTSITDFVNKSDNGKHKNWEWQRILNLLKDSGPENDEDNKEYAVRRIILDFLQAMTDKPDAPRQAFLFFRPNSIRRLDFVVTRAYRVVCTLTPPSDRREAP